jgi:hypothetical protein
MAEAFGRALSKANENRKIKGIVVTDNVPNITHQQYADDMILPSESTAKEARHIKSIIHQYSEASGQMINASKSKIFFINTNPIVENQICNITGFKKGNFPCKYLGIDLEKGTKHNKIWGQILKKLDTKMGGWKDKWLTKTGKVTKIIAVLSTLPSYPLSCLPLPKLINKKLETKFKNFLWKDYENDKKLALIKWDNICKPKELGGLGIRNLN